MRTLKTIAFLIIFALTINLQADTSSQLDRELNLLLDKLNVSQEMKSYQKDKLKDITLSELLNYYKDRKNIKYPSIEDEKSKGSINLTETEIKYANDALNNIFVGQPNYKSYYRGEKIDWITNPVSDNEWIWQLHRMYFWNAMAKSYSKTKDEKYPKKWAIQFVDWVKNNPRPKNNAWRPIEASLRMKGWTENFLRFIDSPNFNEETLFYYLKSVYEHNAYIMSVKPAPQSNIGLMYADALLSSSIVFPEFKEAKNWLKEGAKRATDAMNAQVYPDGHQRELCMGYHIGATNRFEKISDLAKLNNLENIFDKSYHQKLELMCEVPMKITMPNQTNAHFGDTVNTGNPRQYESLFSKWAKTYNRQDFLYMATNGKEGTPPKKTAFALKSSGIYSMRSDWSNDAICLVLKNGRPAGSHTQPDNGTFSLYAGGRTLMPDSGTYIYHGDEVWRNWFRQTKVHQTLTLNEANSNSAPKFLKWETNDNLDVLSVQNQSYKNLKHKRTVLFIQKRFFVIIDEAIGSDTGNVDIHFQLAPCNMIVNKDDLSVKSDFNEGWNILVTAQLRDNLEIFESKGWVSYVYTQKQERPVFAYRIKKTSTEDIKFLTVVQPFKNEFTNITATLENDILRVFENKKSILEYNLK